MCWPFISLFFGSLVGPRRFRRCCGPFAGSPRWAAAPLSFLAGSSVKQIHLPFLDFVDGLPGTHPWDLPGGLSCFPGGGGWERGSVLCLPMVVVLVPEEVACLFPNHYERLHVEVLSFSSCPFPILPPLPPPLSGPGTPTCHVAVRPLLLWPSLPPSLPPPPPATLLPSSSLLSF